MTIQTQTKQPAINLDGLRSDKQAEDKVRSWGYHVVYTWEDGPNHYYAPHSHSGNTTHYVLSGELTIVFEDEGADGENNPHVCRVGQRMDITAGRVHEVWAGPEGCTFVIGEKDVPRKMKPSA